MDSVLDHLNAKILDLCLTCLDKENTLVDNYSTLDIDKEVDNMNPTLWKAICMLARSASEIRDINRQTVSGEQHKKKFRCFFLSMFCVDDHCSMPMHILMSDLIESQRGTILVLNRFGVCSSHDTLKRFIQSKVDTKKLMHPCNNYLLLVVYCYFGGQH